jgi:hypothetical protein
VPDQVRAPGGIWIERSLVDPQGAAFFLPYVLVCPLQPSFVTPAMRAPPGTTKGEFIMRFLGQRGIIAVLLAGLSLLSGCGGGDDGSTGQSGTSGSPQQMGTGAQGVTAAAACPGSGTECTGATILRTDQGISVTDFGVQVYGTSTNDLLTPNPAPQQAYGLRPATGGQADLRVSKAADGRLASVTLLLSNLGLS